MAGISRLQTPAGDEAATPSLREGSWWARPGSPPAPSAPPRQRSPHFNVRAEAVHVDMPVQPQLLGELRGQQPLDVGGEVAQGVPQCQLGEGKGEGQQAAGASWPRVQGLP